jgi:hypothetical protein
MVEDLLRIDLSIREHGRTRLAVHKKYIVNIEEQDNFMSSTIIPCVRSIIN